MANLNKVMLIGRLTRDPESRALPSGSAVVTFGLAVNRDKYRGLPVIPKRLGQGMQLRAGDMLTLHQAQVAHQDPVAIDLAPYSETGIGLETCYGWQWRQALGCRACDN